MQMCPSFRPVLQGPLGSSGKSPWAWLETELAAALGGALCSQTLGRGREHAGGFLAAVVLWHRRWERQEA